MNKISRTLCIFCLVAVCPDGRASAQKLVYKYTSSFDVITNRCDFNGKFYGEFFYRFVHHCTFGSFACRRKRYALLMRDIILLRKIAILFALQIAICLPLANVIHLSLYSLSRLSFACRRKRYALLVRDIILLRKIAILFALQIAICLPLANVIESTRIKILTPRNTRHIATQAYRLPLQISQIREDLYRFNLSVFADKLNFRHYLRIPTKFGPPHYHYYNKQEN